MKTIERIAKLIAFLSPAVMAWLVCPILIVHGSSAAFQLAIWIGVIAMFSASWGILTFVSESN